MKPFRFILFAIAIHISVRTAPVSDNAYYAGVAVVMLIWVSMAGREFSRGEKILRNWWMFWVVNDVMKEAAYWLDILQWLFANPTQKYLSEYIIFGISTGYLIWQLKKDKPDSVNKNYPH